MANLRYILKWFVLNQQRGWYYTGTETWTLLIPRVWFPYWHYVHLQNNFVLSSFDLLNSPLLLKLLSPAAFKKILPFTRVENRWAVLHHWEEFPKNLFLWSATWTVSKRTSWGRRGGTRLWGSGNSPKSYWSLLLHLKLKCQKSYLENVHHYLATTEQNLFPVGMHILLWWDEQFGTEPEVHCWWEAPMLCFCFKKTVMLQRKR